MHGPGVYAPSSAHSLWDSLEECQESDGELDRREDELLKVSVSQECQLGPVPVPTVHKGAQPKEHCILMVVLRAAHINSLTP